tara:strand:+ start:128 stop:775 length:648 start_codon:yes stop_codon:yes gene_type:complete
MDVVARITLPAFASEFDKNIKKEIKKVFASKVIKIIPRIKKKMSQQIASAIRESNVYKDIMAGTQLLGELGLPNPSDLDAVIEAFSKEIEVEYTPNPRLGAIKIGIIESSYSKILSMPEASFISTSAQTGNPTIIEWLRWLLLKGNSVVIKGYQFIPKSAGRTGLGIMAKSSRGNWSVQQRYSGTTDNNFVTRALEDKIEEVIDEIVRQEITKGI